MKTQQRDRFRFSTPYRSIPIRKAKRRERAVCLIKFVPQIRQPGYYLVLTVAIILLFCANSWAAFNSAPYFPIQSGNSWTYLEDGTVSNTISVSSGTTLINGVATKALVDSADGFTAYYTNDSNGIRLHRQFDPDSGITVTFVPPIRLATAVTDIGQTANSSGTAQTNVGNFGYSASITVQALERVTVPAGSFDVVRLGGTVTISGGGTATTTLYVARKIGVVKSIDSDGFSTVIAELTSTNVVPENVQFMTSGATGGPVLAGGLEEFGSSRGPAFQLFDTTGVLQTTRFVLNPNFRHIGIVLANFDADTADEVMVGGRETTGLARGPAYQTYETNGSLSLTRFVLNPNFTGASFSHFNVNSTNGVLVCGRESGGAARGPAYQAFDSSGNLVRTQFGLNSDFIMDNSCLGINLDGVAGDEVIMGGREVTGAARGPALQAFNSNGTLRFTQFVLNPSFTETQFSVMDAGGNKQILVAGRETSGAARGPAIQAYNNMGGLIFTRFILNGDFTNLKVFGANTTNSVAGDEIVTGGTETSGAARGPAIQLWDKNGNILFTRFVLNPDFADVAFSKIDLNNDGVHEILVMGRETKGLARGPAFQIFDGSGTLLVTQFVLNNDFTNLRFFPVDVTGDGDQEIGIGGTETTGAARGPAYQIFESNGTLLQTKFVLNPDF